MKGDKRNKKKRIIHEQEYQMKKLSETKESKCKLKLKYKNERGM